MHRYAQAIAKPGSMRTACCRAPIERPESSSVNLYLNDGVGVEVAGSDIARGDPAEDTGGFQGIAEGIGDRGVLRGVA
jgi:hypothetical protein